MALFALVSDFTRRPTEVGWNKTLIETTCNRCGFTIVGKDQEVLTRIERAHVKQCPHARKPKRVA